MVHNDLDIKTTQVGNTILEAIQVIKPIKVLYHHPFKENIGMVKFGCCGKNLNHKGSLTAVFPQSEGNKANTRE